MKISISLIIVLFSLCASAELINGAGSSFAAPIYSKWSSEYQKIKTDIRINYQSVGSGAGIRQIINKNVDFAGSDAPMKDSELAKASGKIVHIPAAMGAVVMAYNLPELTGELKLTPETITKIFSGKITRWDDPALLALNPNLLQVAVNNPYILTVQRSDGSGTTAIFTEYLCKISAEWNEKVGQGKSVDWPTGLAAKGNEGVTGVIRQNPGAIGYVEMTFASANGMRMALVQNKKGSFIHPSVETVTAAAVDLVIPADMRMSIVNEGGKKAYPISSFTYLLIPQTLPKGKGQDLIDFVKWSVVTGQDYARELHYAPLPKKVVQQIQSTFPHFQFQ